jgi:AcrR family transcriptional regulator
VKRRDPDRRSPGTREKIVDVAERLIAVPGVEGFQVKDVAAAVGIRPASVYAHFEGREAIADEVEGRLYARIEREIVPERIDEGDPTELLLRMARDMIHYYVTHPAHTRLALRDLAQARFPVPAPDAPAWQHWNAIDRAFTGLVRRGIERGAFRRVRPDGAHAQIVGAALASLCWGGWDEAGNPVAGAPVEQIVSEIEELTLRLLRSDEA